MKVHLVDGTFELFRAYFGAPKAQSAEGAEVGATRGLLRSLATLLSAPQVTHVAVAFDTVISSFRNELFDGYKTGEGVEPELLSQFPLAEQAADSLGITVWPMDYFEADDALATGARIFGENSDVEQVVICTPDKDLAQCVVGDRIVTWDRMRNRVLGEHAVLEKFGVLPRSIPDWLALVGDKADGIPGVARWGAKGAAAVLHHYQHIATIPDEVSDWQVKVRGAAGLAEQLRQHRHDAELYLELATLRRDVPLGESPEQLRWTGPSETLGELCNQLGMRAGAFVARLQGLAREIDRTSLSKE